MKKIFSLVILGLLLFGSIPHAIADSSHVSISDAVIADLALRNYLNNVSISMLDGKNNSAISLNLTKQWIPASTIKTYVAMYAYDQINRGNIHSLDNIVMDGKNIVTTELETPELPALYEGEEVSVNRLIKQMITQSDNTAYNQLLDVLDRRSIADYIHSIGLTHTEIGAKLNLDDNQTLYEQTVPGFGINTTTAADYSKAFLLIKANKVPYSQDLLSIFKQQKINDMLPAELPTDVVVAHKTGNWDPLYHDGGIIIPPHGKDPYILSIFTNLGDPTIVAHISQLVYSQDLTLVGQVLGATSNEPLQALDELLKHPPIPTITPEPKKVLGINNLIPQLITAADLGINTNDLSLSINPNDLPKVIVPADSPLHSYVALWYLARKIAAPDAASRTKVDIDALNLQIAEAQSLQKEGKTQEQNILLSNMQDQLKKIAQTNTVANTPSLQTAVEQVSQQRFALLGTNLKQADPKQRDAIIQTIAEQAKETVKTVEPNLPQASNIANPAQQPLIGTVIKNTNDGIIVQTPGGQQITIPTNQNSIKLRSAVSTQQFSPTPTEQLQENITPSYQSSGAATQTTPAPTVQSVQPGTTIAVIGTAQGTTFHPTFMLTNVPRELVAPQPVTVVKVNTKNDTMVVSENGVLTQVDLNKQTIIKADNTNLTLRSIKAGDTVVVHGNPVSPTSTNTQPSITPSAPNTTPTTAQTPQVTSSPTMSPIILSPTAITTKVGAIISSTPLMTPSTKISPTAGSVKGVTPATIPTVVTTQNKTNSVVTTNGPTIPSAAVQTTKVVTPPPPTVPQVVVGKTIQVIDTKQQQNSVPAAPPVHNPTPAAAAPQPAASKPQNNPAPAASAPNPPAAVVPPPVTSPKK